MMKRLLTLALLSASSWGQSLFTTVTATPVQDPNSVAYVNGTYNISYVPATTGLNKAGNYAIAPAAVSGTLDSFGNMSVQLIDNSQVSPAGSQWRFSICSASGVTCFSVNITISGASQDITAALKAAAAILPSTGGTGTAIPGQKIVDSISYLTIQAAITAAGTTGSVVIPSSYAGTDTYSNPSGIQIIDLRRVNASPSRYRGFINMLVDCGLKGDGVTDDSTAANACFALYPGYEFFFPKTQANGTCNYLFNSTLNPTGTGWVILGDGSGYVTSGSFGDHLGGTELCFSPTLSGPGIMMDNVGARGTIQDITLNGQNGTQGASAVARVNLPPVSTLYSKNISSIQRATQVLTVTVTSNNGEGLTAQAGSILQIAGVVGDATMNGTCVVASVSNTSTNPLTFTCSQQGADSGPFGAVGTVIPYTTGTSTQDGIRVCGNFHTIRNVSVGNFGRHGINAASNETGCIAAFSDDLVLDNNFIYDNQGFGVFMRGVDANAGHMFANAIYNNTLWGAYDNSFLGNTWLANQATGNGTGGGFAPATQNISAISRTLSGSNSTVSVTTATANTNIKVGSAVVIAGVTDSSFNTTANSAFFVTQVTDSTHYQYIQPGAPGNASSSGGTSRMGTFSEAILASGQDTGSYKIGVAASVWGMSFNSNYVEGGQACKFGPSVLIFDTPGSSCVPNNGADWAGRWIATGVPGLPGGMASNLTTFTENRDNVNGYTLFFRAGIHGGTTRPIGFNFLDNATSAGGWSQQVSPNNGGAGNGAAGTWLIARGGAGSGGVRRLTFFGPESGAITRISSEGAGAVKFNEDANSGTGGITVCSGGAVPTCPASAVIDSANTHFAAVLKSATANPASAGYERLAKTDAINFRNNAASGDVNGLSLDGSDVVQVGGNTNGVRIGTAGAALKKVLTTTSVIDFASQAANTCTDSAGITLTGALDGDSIDLGVPAADWVANVEYSAYVSASDTVKVRLCNNATGASADPASGTFRVTVRQY
jgi:hypothetical protein